MAAALIYSLAPVKINTTVLAADDLQLTPDIATIPFRHSGNEFASVMAVPGGKPALKFKTPFAEAYALIGLKVLKATALEVYLAKFVDALRQSGAVHRKYSLATGAVGMVYLMVASVSQNGILMADVVVVLLNPGDGTIHPLVTSDSGTIPALAAEPILYTNGPTKINGTTIGGTSGARLDLGSKVDVRLSDGDLYPRVCGWLGGDPSIAVDHADPATLWTAVGLLGVAATSIVQYFRQFDTTTQSTLGTGISLTITSGRAVPDAIGVRSLDVAKAPLRIIGLSATSTHPVVVATGVAVPVP
jgi:hypothetical protein